MWTFKNTVNRACSMAQDKIWLEIMEKNQKESQRMLSEAIKELTEIGKEPFDLQELKKYWSFRYEKQLNEDQINKAMQDIERDYYFLGKLVMTMQQYGKQLMEMELYSWWILKPVAVAVTESEKNVNMVIAN